MAAPHHRNRRFRGAEHTNLLVLRRGAGERTAVRFRGVSLVRSHDEAREPPKRRIARAFALLDLITVEGLTIAGYQRPYHRVFRLVLLFQVTDATPSSRPARPTT